MKTAVGLLIMALVFGLVIYMLVRRVWRLYRVISVSIPVANDVEAFSYRLTETIRGLRYRENPPAGAVRTFRAPAWQQWAVGLQDIRLEPAGSGNVLLTGPAFNVSLIGRGYTGARMIPYAGPQPVWPLLKGMLKIMGVGVGFFAASGVALFLFGPR